jgi:hypothetical protein
MYNDFVKINDGEIYTVVKKDNPEFSDEIKTAQSLTKKEIECVKNIIENKIGISEAISLTRTAFGRPTFIFC